MAGSKNWLQSGGGKIVAYFLQGMLLLAPVCVTLYIIIKIFVFLDVNLNAFFENISGFHLPHFFGLLCTCLLITFIGFIGSLVFVQPFFHLLDLIIEKTPLVKDLYSSLKDFFGAFISNKKKFNKAVMFELTKGSGVYKLGFITHEALEQIGIPDKVAVYAPLSYNLSGLLYVVNKDQIQVLTDVSPGELMKFIVSGGVTEIEDEPHHLSHRLHK